MSKKDHDKKLKRKRKLDAKKKKAEASINEYFTESKKFKDERYLPLIYLIEDVIRVSDMRLRQEGKMGFTDSQVGTSFRGLIQRVRTEGLSPDSTESETIEKSEGKSEDLVAAIYPFLVEEADEQQYTQDEVLGVLRTLNTSRVFWNEQGGVGDRGYLGFISRGIVRTRASLISQPEL